MTTPPQGEHEQPEGQPADDRIGARSDDEPNASRPAPAWELPRPGPGSGYGQGTQPPGTPFHGPPRSAGQPPHGSPQYGPPGQAYGQPPYGYQPSRAEAYGQPAGAPLRRSRTGLTAALIGGVLLLVAGAAALAFTLQATVLDRTSVERDVATQFQQREGVALDLDCAQEMVVDEGATYECTGTTEQGEEVTLEIAITDETDAAYTWGAP
jgi:hypothetical protein